MNQVTQTIQKESFKSQLASRSCFTDSENLRTRELQRNQISGSTTSNPNDSLASALAMADFVSDNDIKLVIDHVKQTSSGDEQEQLLLILKKCQNILQYLPKRQPMTSEIYQFLIKSAEGPNYPLVRLRVALCLLTLTGLQINQLLKVKVSHLQTLQQFYWIKVTSSRSSTANRKAVLSKEGKKLINERKKDFNILFQSKDSAAYVFTAKSKPYQMLRRETITRDINRVLQSLSRTSPNQPHISSYSFRIGYIETLWKNPEDSKVVKQAFYSQEKE